MTALIIAIVAICCSIASLAYTVWTHHKTCGRWLPTTTPPENWLDRGVRQGLIPQLWADEHRSQTGQHE